MAQTVVNLFHKKNKETKKNPTPDKWCPRAPCWATFFFFFFFFSFPFLRPREHSSRRCFSTEKILALPHDHESAVVIICPAEKSREKRSGPANRLFYVGIGDKSIKSNPPDTKVLIFGPTGGLTFPSLLCTNFQQRSENRELCGFAPGQDTNVGNGLPPLPSHHCLHSNPAQGECLFFIFSF